MANQQTAASPKEAMTIAANAANRLTTRDLINAGIFSALFFVITLITGMVGFVGPQFMFLGGINGLAFMLTGHYFWTLLAGLVLGFLADLIINKVGLSITKAFPLAYAVFCMWIAAPFTPLILNTESYYADIADQMGQSYADSMAQVFQPWTIGVVAIGAFIIGYIGAVIGLRVSRKNFESAGLL